MMSFHPWASLCNERSELLRDLMYGFERASEAAGSSILASHNVPVYVAEYMYAMSRLCRIGLAAAALPPLRMANALFDTAVAGVQIMQIHVNRMHGAWAHADVSTRLH